MLFMECNIHNQENDFNSPPIVDNTTTKSTEPNAGTSAMLELTRPWHRTKRAVVGDFAFTSVNTCV